MPDITKADAGALEAASSTVAATLPEEIGMLVVLGGRKADLAERSIRSGDLVRAAEDLRAAADYLDVAGTLSSQPRLRIAA